jgi:TonB family protein
VSGGAEDSLGGTGLSPDVLARFSDLLEADPLPDKTTIDFAVESLRSLMAAYPDDGRVPAALARLNERLVVEARQSYDNGDAFRAGRLIEQATSLGMAEASIAETLAYFEQQPPGSGQNVPAEVEVADVSVPAPTSGRKETEDPVQSAAVRPDDAAETELMEAVDRELAAADVPQVPADDGLDSLVESATGLALGALAVEVVVEDADLAEPDSAGARGPLPTSMQDEPVSRSGVESRVRSALDTVLREASTAPAVSANDLPDGFALDEYGVGRSSASAFPPTDAAGSASSDPIFRPYSELTPRRQDPLVYPRRAAEGAEGSLEVEFTVTERGDVTDVSVRGDVPSIFLREALRTIRQWQFEPVLSNGEAVPVRTALRITYRG